VGVGVGVGSINNQQPLLRTHLSQAYMLTPLPPTPPADHH
jgi:hypothetical protein